MEPKLLTADRHVDSEMGISYRYVYSDTERFRLHFHDYYEIFILLEGNTRHLVNGKEFLIEPQTAVFIRPNDTHDYVCVDGKPFSMLNLTFTKETADALFSYLGNGFETEQLHAAPYPPKFRFHDMEYKSFKAQMTSIRAISPEQIEQKKTALRILLFRLLTKGFSAQAVSEQSEMPLWLQRLCVEMRKNENFVYGAERMIELSGKSREHVARSLKRHTGQTISEFVGELRLTFIANMLKNSNHSISHILFESGFNNVSWASEQFRQKYGMTMREFRNS